MKLLFAAGLVLSLAACAEDKQETHANWAEAERAGAVERGWLPPFVPTSATEINDNHNLDTNAQKLEFTVPAQDVGPMLESITPSTELKGELAARALTKAGWKDSDHSNVQVILMCTQSYSGALLANRRTGRSVYISPAEWARERCPRPH